MAAKLAQGEKHSPGPRLHTALGTLHALPMAPSMSLPRQRGVAKGRQSLASSLPQPGLCTGMRAGKAVGVGSGAAGCWRSLLPPCGCVAQGSPPDGFGRVGGGAGASWVAPLGLPCPGGQGASFASQLSAGTANGKFFLIPSAEQIAGKAEQEGIKRPLLPLCSCWERGGGVCSCLWRVCETEL